MNKLTALTISVPVTGIVATYLALMPLNGVYLIWAAFVFWGGYFALGASTDALKKIIACGTLGAVIAWLTSLAILNIPLADVLGSALWAAVAVGIGVAVAFIAANVPLFAAVPATVFGIATSFGYLLQTPNVMTAEALTSPTLANVIVLIPLSAIFGGVFGHVSGLLGAAMAKDA